MAPFAEGLLGEGGEFLRREARGWGNAWPPGQPIMTLTLTPDHSPFRNRAG